MWEELTRAYFFSADSAPKKADELFLQRYCSELTLTNIKKANLDVASLRHALSKISELLPELDHATPGWSAEGKDQLLVCFGKAHLQNRGNRKVPVIRKPRFGLCAVDGAARIWADDSFIFGGGHEESDYEWFDLGHWEEWVGRPKASLFKGVRLDLGSFPEHFDQISSPGPLWGFLQAMGRATGSSEWEVQEEFSSLRAMQGVPEEFSVVYPKLVSRDALAGKGGRKERQTSSGNSSKALTTTGPSNAVTTIDSAAVEPGESLPPSGGDTNPSSADNDESADAVYESVTGSYYVYVLRDPVSRDAAPFYVGKGLFDRANQHLGNAGRAKANRNAGDSENQDVEAMYGADAVSIWKNESKQLRSGDESEKNNKITELVTAGRDKADIPRVVARTLSEEAALAVEAMLIESVYSQGVLTNIARGHHRQRFRSADDWTYLEGFDLPVDGDGSFKADAGKHKHGPFYVYVLRDPDSGKIFYVGKGKGNRLCQHFEMSANADRWAGVARLQRLAELLGKGRKPHEIGRVVARTTSEALAFVLESFYIKFVLGFGQLLNVQPGHM